MKKILLITLGWFVFLSPSATAQSGWDEEGLKDYVQMIKQRCYEAVTTSNSSQKGDAANCLLGNNDYIFNESGKCVEILGYDEDNVMWKAVYTYSSTGKEAEMDVKDAENVLQTKSVYKYNAAGKPIEEYLYNSKGDLLEKLIHGFDKHGINKVSTSCYHPKGNLRWREDYEYDKQGYKIGYEHYDAEGKLDWRTLFKNDSLGNKIEEISYDSNGDELSYYTYKYVYDGHDNWINQTVYSNINDDNIPENIIEREITYY